MSVQELETPDAVNETQVGYSIRPGYKQTEVGLIPEDWEVVALGSIASFRTGPFGSSLHMSDYVVDGIPVINPMQIVGGIVVPTFDMTITELMASRLSDFQLKRGEIIIGRRGEMGRCAVITDVESGWLCGTGSMIIRVRKDNSAAHVCRLLSSAPIVAAIENASVGTTMVNLNNATMSGLKLPLPPTLAEQNAIASALGDADALVESLERLLAKKRNLKQAAMQQLLTGKIRLPGFEKVPGFKESEIGAIPKDWSIRLLPEVARFRGGKAHEQFVSDSGRFICVNSKFISSDGTVRKYCTKSFCTASHGDVLIVMSDLPNGKALAKAFFVNEDELYAVNQRVCALSAFDADPKYLYYALNRNPYFLKFDDGVTQTHLLNGVFEKCPVVCPKGIAEQTAIATVLSDMDVEIAAIEAKIKKARQIKAGMMQELLTGKTRIV